MKTLIIVSVSVLLFGGSVASPHTPQQAGGELVRIHFSRDIDTSHLSINYFLTGSFGGYGSFVRTEPGKWDYEIDTTYEGRPAKTLKAMVFCSGYQFNLVNVRELNDNASARDLTLELKPLRSIDLSGKVILPKHQLAAGLVVEARYLARWGHDFFGIADGLVRSFVIGSTALSSDGSFSIAVPDFAHDPTIESFKRKGAIALILRQPKTGNILYLLERSKTPGRDTDIEIGADYPDELILYARNLRK